MMQHKKELVDFTLSVLENPDCSAAFVPMAVKTVRPPCPPDVPCSI